MHPYNDAYVSRFCATGKVQLLNIQTEHQADHTARVTVELPHDQLEKAKLQAARKISGRVNIPGFRKGKAPYSVVARYYGEQAIVTDAFEILADSIYKQMLSETGLDPYGPGSFQDFKVDPAPTMVFSVPLQPVVQLGDYRSVRLPYDEPKITDDTVDRALKNLQEQQAVIEESTRPAQLTDRVTVDIHSHIVREQEVSSAEDAPESADEPSDGHDHEHDHDHDHDHHHDDDDTFIHEHAAAIILDADHEPVPGFAEALVGIAVSEQRSFDLIVPDNEAFGDAAGKTVHFTVTASKIENMTLPVLNDEFAARLTQSEEKPLTLLELRVRVRENLRAQAEADYRADYVRRALDEIVRMSDIRYPEALVADEIEELLKQFDRQLQQQGFTLKDYQNVLKRTDQDLYTEYRPSAVSRVERGLVMRELTSAERINVTAEELLADMEQTLGGIQEDQRDSVRQLLQSPDLRRNALDQLYREKTTQRIIEIAQGRAPELPPDSSPEGESDSVAEETVKEGESA